MPTIKPFRAIHPLSAQAVSVVSTIEEMSLETAKHIRTINPLSFIHLLVPELKVDTPEQDKKELAFELIAQNLHRFLHTGVLNQENEPAIYIYQVFKNQKYYRGIWTCTLIDDYAKGIIEKHEHIKPKREEQLIDYLEKTGIDANPVLLAYRTSPTIQHLISLAIGFRADIEFSKDAEKHSVWKIKDSSIIAQFLDCLANIGTVYIADGHHRISAALKYGLKRRSTEPAYTGKEEFNYFSSIYIPDNELEIQSFNRLVRFKGAVKPDVFLSLLRQSFSVTPITTTSEIQNTEIGLYIAGSWYKLELRPSLLSSNFIDSLAVSVLQDHIIKPLLEIENPEKDERLDFLSGGYSTKVLEEKVNSSEADIAFYLNPITMNTLTKIADRGDVLPAKSTWFEPKFPVGLLMHYID
ncbi:MAG: DUF1015 domain-containing protein [Pyrinomonadaceae bacterium]|nr:DUF1015 domain-containing protein [Sphingobacteriaceae bacterium]